MGKLCECVCVGNIVGPRIRSVNEQAHMDDTQLQIQLVRVRLAENFGKESLGAP